MYPSDQKPQDLEEIRAARAEIMRLSPPEDSYTTLLILLVGPVAAADYLSGRQPLTRQVLLEAIDGQEGISQKHLAALLEKIQQRAQNNPQKQGILTGHQEATLARACGAYLLVPEDDLWPAALDDLGERAPYGLWVRGDSARLKDLSLVSSLALVGSRDSSPYGNSCTQQLAGQLAAQGKTIVSGGAYGIDAQAHAAALATASGPLPTLALMAGGLDRLYPRSNSGLLEAVVEQGLLASEIPLGQSPTRWRFLQRNRLIAALASATVVVEARWRSGALNTAHHALELGRRLYAVPGPITSPNSEGCHRLLKDGLARLATRPEDIQPPSSLQASHLDAQAQEDSLFAPVTDARQLAYDRLTELEQRSWDLLPLRGGISLDALAQQLGQAPRQVMLALQKLDSSGLACQFEGRWVKAPATS